MSRVQQIEGQIKALDQTELKALREWLRSTTPTSGTNKLRRMRGMAGYLRLPNMHSAITTAGIRPSCETLRRAGFLGEVRTIAGRSTAVGRQIVSIAKRGSLPSITSLKEGGQILVRASRTAPSSSGDRS